MENSHPPPDKLLTTAPGEEPSAQGATAPARDLRAGDKLGRYTIMDPLGAGGMGAVYRAHDERLERVVAIKVLLPGVVNGIASRQRFRREGLALAKLSHPGIASVHDVGDHDGVDYIVMECVPGESLGAKLKSGALPVREATTILLQIAEALEEAHDRSIVHRDLKPGNVMVTPRGQVKVLDFGIAKLLEPGDTEASMAETRGLIGTPRYMSPEQVQDQELDGRSDLWSLGVLYFEALSACPPFPGRTSLAVLGAVLQDPPLPLRELRPGLPPLALTIVNRCLEKDPARRYQSATEVARDASILLAELDQAASGQHRFVPHKSPAFLAITTLVLILAIAAGFWLYHRAARRTWAHQQAIPQINGLLEARRPLAASFLLRRARQYLPADPQLKQLADANTTTVSITSTPSGATVQIQDYLAPESPWRTLGTTPLTNIEIPVGYFLWKVSKPGIGEMLLAPITESKMDFPLAQAQAAPPGMVFVPGGPWSDYVSFVGWVGPYKLPAFFIDRYEVTNQDFQKFVDAGGYTNQQYWPATFVGGGRSISFTQAMADFRDTTARPGPSTWVAGHYPEGKADFPVSGVSWYEASAYAAFAGKELPALAQWLRAAPPDTAGSTVVVSNISNANASLAPVGAFKGIGPYGTYDMAGNVREWASNTVDDGLRTMAGGSWRSAAYLYSEAETTSPFDRADMNGFRCVRNIEPLPAAAAAPIQRTTRDFSQVKPVSDAVFDAYKVLYSYPNMPLDAVSDGIVRENADWREEKVEFNTGYRGERMAAYLFLPKNVKPPFQTVLFYPSARVVFSDSNDNGRSLGDMQFFDYILQSGRAVMYPIYEGIYERQVHFNLPSGSQSIEITTDGYKDAARSLDYLATRSDIDASRFAYLGVSMGAAEGIIAGTLLQDRLKTVIFLDGGYFLDSPPPGGDQAEFAPRLKKPVLMVNGRYDYVFSVDKAQNPLFTMLGTPPQDKRHLLLDTPHDVSEQKPQLSKAVLDWLDHYLGPVGN